MKEVLLFAWQLPQNLLGLLLVWLYDAESVSGEVYWSRTMRGGISLGHCIILSKWMRDDSLALCHERGHQVQSRRWGWLYLPVVGLASVLHLLCRRNGIIWTKDSDYYSVWPENEADRLGGIIRDENGKRRIG